VAKKIFKANEVTILGSKVIVTPPSFYQLPQKEQEGIPEAEEVEEAEEVKEAEAVEAVEVEKPEVETEEVSGDKLLEEARRIKEEAEQEAKRIKEEAEQTAFKIMQENTIKVRELKEEAEKEAEKIVSEAKSKADEIIREAEEKATKLLEDSRQKGYEEGREEGYRKGEEEVRRLVEHLHTIINAAIDKRKEIVESSEKQIIDLVMLIARKVVKAISEAEKKVVLENIREALKKLRGDTEIVIRVNIDDLDIVSKHKKEFVSMVESLESIRIEEDSRVDPGGCIIETSFGEIDARIQTQLQVLEERIRELVPLKE